MKFLHRLHSAEQRSTYRVRAAGEDARIWVGLTDGPVEAELIDISARGCAFVLSEERAAELEPDVELVLRIAVGGNGMPQLYARARARSRSTERQRVRIGCEFVDPQRLYTQLEEPQWLFFNRRGAFRVPPADERGRPLRADFHLPGHRRPRTIALHDLSSSGLAIDLCVDDEIAVPEDRPLRVTFALPLDGREIDLMVRFVHRTVIAGRQRIGFRFDPSETASIEAQTEAIVRYVLERQRQILRRG